MFDEFAKFRRDALAHAEQFRQYAEESGMKPLAKRIDQFNDALDQIRYNIAVVGNMKRGKSTLLNAILGRSNDDVSPVDAKVCTAGIVQYIDTGDPAAKERALVFYEHRSDCDEILVHQVRDYVTEERNPENRKKVRRVEVHGYFPLLNRSVTLIDTPGCGSVNKHHETLVEQFLPNADAIIFPIDSGNPIDASERQFLELLNEQDKDRIFFVLTKCDALEPEDRGEVDSFVRAQISKAGLVCSRLQFVSAKALFEARKAGKSASEVERIALESGVAELERELEAFILSTSNKNDLVRQRISNVLNECSSFCRIEIDRLDSEIRNFDRDVVQLEADLADAKKAAEALRTEHNKALRAFEKKWDLRISRFDRDLSRHSDRISDAIVDRLHNRGFVKTVADSTKFGSEVARRVDNEIASTVAELEDHLSTIVRELHEELDQQLEIYRKRCKLSNFPTSIAAASGSALIVGAGFLGITTVAPTLAAASAAWVAVGTAGTTGAIQAFWGWLVGAGATASQAATVTAIGATITSIATAGGAIAALYIAKTVAHWGVAAFQENRIPTLVEKALCESGTQVIATLTRRRELLVEQYRDVLEDLIETQDSKMVEIISAINENDPTEKEKRIRRREQINQFLSGNNRLELKIQELPKIGMS
jgi:GTP-binding protein EngB required for normal cell division